MMLYTIDLYKDSAGNMMKYLFLNLHKYSKWKYKNTKVLEVEKKI